MLISLYLTTSCSTTRDKADELYEAGLFEAAVDMYNKAIVEDPEDTAARIGLDKAQQGVISKGLIEVRMLRMAGDQKTATEKLEGILRKESGWNIKFNAGMTITQKNEVAKSSKWIRSKQNQAKEESKPDVFRWYTVRFRKITQASSQKTNHNLDQDINKQGQANCIKMQSLTDKHSFFLREFIQNYCASWNISWDAALSPVDPSRYQSIYITNKVNVSNHGGKGISLRDLLAKIEENFRNSVWFSSRSQKRLNVTLLGKLSYAHRKRNSIRRTEYITTEEIKEKELKKVLQNGKQTEKEVEVTKRIKKTKIHKYPITVHNEQIGLEINSEISVWSTPLRSFIQDQKNKSSESTKERFVPARIYPTPPELMDTSTWLKGRYDQLIKKQNHALGQLWTDRFCRGQQQEVFNTDETVLRCAALEADNPLVQAWFKKHFALSRSEFMTSLENPR